MLRPRTSLGIQVLSMPLANTEYELAIPRDTQEITLKLRAKNVDLLLAYATGNIAAGTYITVPAGSSKTVSYVRPVGQSLFIQTASASQTLEVEFVKA